MTSSALSSSSSSSSSLSFQSGISCIPYPLPFFDALPDDTLIHIIQRLSRHCAESVATCPILNLAQVSPSLRRLIATEVGSRLAFSSYADPAWFFAWLRISGPALRDLSFHNRTYRTVGTVRHLWPPGCTTQHARLDPEKALRYVLDIRPRLVELDVSGLQKPSHAAMHTLSLLLTDVRSSLSVLKLDLNHPHIVPAVASARLYALRRLVVVNSNAQCEHNLLPLLSALRRYDSSDSPVVFSELSLDACDSLPSSLLSNTPLAQALLAELEVLHLDFDDELHSFCADSVAAAARLSVIVRLPALRRVCLSGSGIPITSVLVKELREASPAMSELRLVDCDVDPAPRLRSLDSDLDGALSSPRTSVDEARVARACRTLASVGPLLTQYYPRWVTFDVRLLNALANHCPRLTHLRVFTAQGAERALSKLGERLGDSLVDLEMYPKSHEGKGEMAGAIVKFVTGLRALQRVCLVTLDLSAEQLKTVLKECGPRLKMFAFSPSSAAERVRDLSAKVMADVLIQAAEVAPNLERVDVIFPHDWPPTVETRPVMMRVRMALAMLEARCVRLEMGNLRALMHRMTPVSSDDDDMLSDGEEDEDEESEGEGEESDDDDDDDDDEHVDDEDDNDSDDDIVGDSDDDIDDDDEVE